MSTQDHERDEQAVERGGHREAENVRLRAALMETECALNAATDGSYLPHRFDEHASPANHLYAAAPDLLAALKGMLRVCPRERSGLSLAEYESARAAVRKAEGQS